MTDITVADLLDLVSRAERLYNRNKSHIDYTYLHIDMYDDGSGCLSTTYKGTNFPLVEFNSIDDAITKINSFITNRSR